MSGRPEIASVVIQLDLAEPEEVAAWRAAMSDEESEEALEVLAAQEAGELIVGSLYVETAYGTGEDDIVALTMTGVELRRGEDPLAQVDDEWLADALQESAQQLADEQDLEVSLEQLREVLTVQASAEVLHALGGGDGPAEH